MTTNSKEYNAKVYKKYWGSKEGIQKRVKQNAARRLMERLGKVKKGDGKEVNHIRGTKAGNGKSNLEVISRLKNRVLGQKKAMAARRRNGTTTYNKG